MTKLENLLFTLEVCRKVLPEDASMVHYARLDEIERILRYYMQAADNARKKDTTTSLKVSKTAG